MAIVLRKVKNKNATGGFSYIALCAARTRPRKGDIYLDDSMHHALSEKFRLDFMDMGGKTEMDIFGEMHKNIQDQHKE